MRTDIGAGRFPLVSRLTDAPPVVLVRHGRLQRKNLRQENITEEELKSKLREAGLDGYEKVRAAYLEGDGSFSVLKRRG